MKEVRRVPKLPPRRADAHKGDFGRVLCVAGSVGMFGAAVLCARAAMRGGAGLVRVGLPPELVPLLPLAVPEAMTFERRTAQLREHVAAADASVVGPGLSTAAATGRLLQQVLAQATAPVVLDADALNVLAPLPAPPKCTAPLVLTPHPGEAARLLGSSTEAVQSDRVAAVDELCRRSGAVVVLKGAGTLVGDGERRFRNRTGNPGMATAGSGDVLAGLLAALLARGLEPFDAACLAVHTHGAAGDLGVAERGRTGLIASDLCDA
ncbi:MAG: NAD(P)H-hydrate dehydratase, partial [Planctomycetes bacterium]|nr:NAD(P)H-hydrate dehydratase [Planctomycetota bacterium]